jgi:glyoxylase-like metal-dependent hydrolase (beta-lactamase superfamily II)
MIPTPPGGGKTPQLVLPNIWAFAPNRDTLGGTAYYVNHPQGGILVDCPAWNTVNLAFLETAPVQSLFLTHRGGVARVQEWRSSLGCDLWIQEQEAYLLPGLSPRSFQFEVNLAPDLQGFWVPGHSPGSSCLYWQTPGVLFTGRHLLPDSQGNPVPLQTRKTFHWPRQMQQVQAILDRFQHDRFSNICPGANTGLLRGQGTIDRAYDRLNSLNSLELSGTPD